VIGAEFFLAAAASIAGGASPGLAPGANVSATGVREPLGHYLDALLLASPAANPNAIPMLELRAREIAGILTKGHGPDRTLSGTRGPHGA
jgi:hypothetical protein